MRAIIVKADSARFTLSKSFGTSNDMVLFLITWWNIRFKNRETITSLLKISQTLLDKILELGTPHKIDNVIAGYNTYK